MDSLMIARNNTTTALDALKPLIAENYKKRLMKDSPDEWFWADELAIELGANSNYYGSLNETNGITSPCKSTG